MLFRPDDLPGRWISLAEDDVTSQALGVELVRECGSREHSLYGAEVKALARCGVCDEVLYWLPQRNAWAVVHLTWRSDPETEPFWPSAELCNEWSEVVSELIDHGH